MVEIRFDKKFTIVFSKLNNFMKQKIIKQIQKISENPKIGKPMKYERKGTNELYVKPFRLSYTYNLKEEHVYILGLYHKKKQ